MPEKEIVVSMIRQQRDLLGTLIAQLEAKQQLDESDCKLYDDITQRVECNLRKLRKLN